jgi:hypothetical protein
MQNLIKEQMYFRKAKLYGREKWRSQIECPSAGSRVANPKSGPDFVSVYHEIVFFFLILQFSRIP